MCYSLITKMKKIGIITLHGIYNYGSFFQAFATQEVLKKLGLEVEIIDYVYPNKIHKKKNSFISFFRHVINNLLMDFFCGGKHMSFVRKYSLCKKKYFNLSKRYVSQESIYNDPPIYDVYVVGSDQIWRPLFTKGDGTYFADFAPCGKKLVSYATSFGKTTLNDAYKIQYRIYLERIKYLSVREPSGKDIIKELLPNKKVEVVLDPTFLLSSDYLKTMAINPLPNCEYVFWYGYKSEEVLGFVRYIKKKTRWKIVRTNGNFLDLFDNDVHYILDADPLEWLGLIKNAKFVIAGSFHGTALSINMNIPFIALLQNKQDHDFRQINILEQFGIGEQVFSETESYDILFSKIFSINWHNVNQKRSQLVEKSVDYLKRAILE